MSGEGLGPSPLQEHLREPGLRIDPRPFPDLPQPDGEEAHRQHDKRTGSGLTRAHAIRYRWRHIQSASTSAITPISICHGALVAVLGKPKMAW